MGKGLSPLQKDILAVLAEWPAAVEGAVGDMRTWAEPKDIMTRLGRSPTPSNRVIISKALNRLLDRELIAIAYAQRCRQGNGGAYRRTRDFGNI